MFDKKYKLIGIVVSDGAFPCFAVPVFRLENYTYVLNSESDRIVGFSDAVIDGDVRIIYDVPQLDVMIGDDVIYAFFQPYSGALVGSREYLSSKLTDIIFSIEDNPFLCIDVYDFVGDVDRFNLSVAAAEKMLMGCSHRLAKRWKRNMVRGEYRLINSNAAVPTRSPAEQGHDSDDLQQRTSAVSLSFPSGEFTGLRPRVAVIGVGGAGGNAINNMISSRLEGVEFIHAHTDAQVLAQSRANGRIQLGREVTQGLGAGGRPDIGRVCAEESVQDINALLFGYNMVFITAGMGGGTGTGAAPVIARAAREMGVLTVGLVTKPFHFEGVHRMRTAEAGIEEMAQYVDALIVIPNQNLFRVATERTSFADAFRMADDVLYSAVRAISDLMTLPGLINLDFDDIRTVMSEIGGAMVGVGEADGENRAVAAAEAAISNPLLDDTSMKGAKGVLINITGGLDMTLFEVDEAANRVRDEVDSEANIIFGSVNDEKLNGRMRVSVLATGIPSSISRTLNDIGNVVPKEARCEYTDASHRSGGSLFDRLVVSRRKHQAPTGSQNNSGVEEPRLKPKADHQTGEEFEIPEFLKRQAKSIDPQETGVEQSTASPRVAGSLKSQPTTRPAPTASQNSSGAEEPQPKPNADRQMGEDSDIPAFLRRMAN